MARPDTSSSGCDSSCLDELWQNANVDLDAMSNIVGSHFGSLCVCQSQIGGGGYARVFKLSLQDGKDVAARITLPLEERIKTEAEVATMDSLRALTSIPIPKVHIFCSSSDNPVRAEWIVMDYVPGTPLCDCFGALPWEQKKNTARDLANVLAQTFALAATYCGSLLADASLKDGQRAIRYSAGSCAGPRDVLTTTSNAFSGTFQLGPINDPVFFDNFYGPVPPSQRGPFATERQYLEAMAYRGLPGLRPSSKEMRWPYDKALEIYDAIRPLFRDLDDSRASAPHAPLFHFAHNDLNAHNILLDPETGHITGVLDWEMSSFCPSWWAARPSVWFGDDRRRFIMDPAQHAPDGFEDETAEAAEVRAYFREELRRLSPLLYENYWRGVELRAICDNISVPGVGNLLSYLDQYEKFVWNAERGAFPFDFNSWWKAYYRLSLPHASPSDVTD